MFCSHCGAENQSSSKFCVQCGKPLSTYETTTPPAYDATIVTPSSASGRGMSILPVLLQFGAVLWGIPTFILELIAGLNTLTCLVQNSAYGYTTVQYYLRYYSYYDAWTNGSDSAFIWPTPVAIVSMIVFFAGALFALALMAYNLFSALQKLSVLRKGVGSSPLPQWNHPMLSLILNGISMNLPGIGSAILTLKATKRS